MSESTSQPKTLQERERELQVLMTSPEGQRKLRELETSYSNASGKTKPAKSSVITYILVYERAHGLISG